MTPRTRFVSIFAVLSVWQSCMPVSHAHTIRKQRKTIVSDIFVPSDAAAAAIATTQTTKKKKSKELNCVVKHKKQGKGKSSVVSIPSPAPSRTYAPTKSSKGSKGSYCPTIVSACSLMEMEQAEFGTFDYVVDLKLAIDKPVADVVDTLQTYLQDALSVELAACVDFDVRRRRRLQDSSIMKLELTATEDTDAACPETFTDASCANVDVAMKVTHDEGDADVIRNTLLQAVKNRCADIQALDGIVDTFDPCPFISITGAAGNGGTSDVTGDGSEENAIGEGSGEGDGSSTGEGTSGSDGGSSAGGGTSGSDGGSSTGGGTSGSDGTGSSGSDNSGADSGEDGTTTDGGDGTSGATSGTNGSNGEDGEDGNGDDKGIAMVVQTQSTEERVKTPGYIAMGAAVGIILLLLLLVARRRREYYAATKHKHFVGEEDDDTETYLKDSDEDSFEQTEHRTAHIVGEADSVFSGWSGFTKDQRRGNEGLYPEGYNDSLDESYENQDVHQCSSATCELCERKRRAGVTGLQFVPASMPSHSSNGHNETRHYMTEDTVAL